MTEPADPVPLIREYEESHFESLHECPLWPAVSLAREMLRNELNELQKFRDARGDSREVILDELQAGQAREVAILHLAGLGSRSVGSVVALISCGYVPEAKAPLRRLTEAVLRARTIADDESGSHARAWLAGRPFGSLASLESRYGRQQSFKYLSVAAHADIAGLLPLETDHPERVINLAPQRDDAVVEAFFRMVLAQILMLIGLLLNTYDEYMPSIATGAGIDALQEKLGLKAFRSAESPHIQIAPGRYIPISDVDPTAG